jgi:hypothetical protein
MVESYVTLEPEMSSLLVLPFPFILFFLLYGIISIICGIE